MVNGGYIGWNSVVGAPSCVEQLLVANTVFIGTRKHNIK